MLRRALVPAASVTAVLLLTIALAGSSPSPAPTGRGGPEVAAPGHFSVSAADSGHGPISVGNDVSVGAALKHDTSPALRDLPPKPVVALPAESENDGDTGSDPSAPHAVDPVVQSSAAAPAMPATTLNFEGIDFPGVSCNCAPPDTNGEPGATQYVQIVNEGYQVWNKTTGASVFGPVGISTIWGGFGGVCENNGHGDPVVLYDQFANRWLVSQFAGTSIPTDECIALSTSSDATGSYNRYDYVLGTNFFDYPKLGVWPDGYYMSDNVFNPAATTYLGTQPFVFDRSLMLTGGAATFQTTGIVPGGGNIAPLIPADVDGSTQPPANAPETFVAFPDTGHYDTYHYHVDWGTPANSTLTLFASPAAAGFTQACGACVPQKGTHPTSFLDTLADRLMFRLAYRNFGSHESVVGSYTVASGGVTGVRWFELRNVTSGPETVFQESTFQPDTTYRWMPSAAMDHNGDIAVGYSASSSSIYPELRYAGRLASDSLGSLAQGEATLFAGTGSQQATNSRWGDYSDMTVDPVDDCTFWFTSEYYSVANSQFDWRTRIGSFTLPGCGGSTPPSVSAFAPTTTTPTNGASVSYGLTFSESVTGLTAGDFSRTGSATGCVVGAPAGSGAAYTIAVTGCSEGTVILTLNANTVTDLASTVGPTAPSTATTVTIDRTAPTATLAPPSSPTNTATLSYSAGFNESVTGVAAGDFTVTGTATGCVVGAPTGSGASRTVPVNSCSAGSVVLTLKAGSVTDLAGNPGPASDVAATSVLIDRTAPAVTSFAPTTPSPTNAATVSYSLVFDESVTGLAAGDFTRTGTASGCVVGAPAGSGTTYTIAVTSCSDGTVILTLNASTVTDAATNSGPTSPSVASTVTINRSGPSAGWTPPASPTNAASLPFGVTFDTSVTGLTAGDFTVTGTAAGCVVGAPSGSGASYIVTLTGCGGGSVILTLKAGSVVDGLSNPGPVGDVAAPTVIVDRTAPTTTPPAASLRSGVVLTGTALPILLAWTGADAGGSGVATYDVARSYDGGAFTIYFTGLTTVTPATTIASGHTYRFEVRAHDRAGNVGGWTAGPTLKPSLLQQTSTSILYHLSWPSSTSTAFSGGTARYATAAGAYASYTFSGRSIAFVTTRSLYRGSVKIYIDGVYVTTFSCYATSTTYRYVAFARTWSSVGTHTIKIVVVGTAGHPRVDLDAFEVAR